MLLLLTKGGGVIEPLILIGILKCLLKIIKPRFGVDIINTN